MEVHEDMENQELLFLSSFPDVEKKNHIDEKLIEFYFGFKHLCIFFF